jgi:catechol 2,3-dioxygenase-like lactoylglutathione lyase family enzyme
MPTRALALSTFLVRDYDEAIAFFVGRLGFSLLEDRALDGGKRWLVVAPERGGGLLLARAAGDAQQARIGDQTGGRVAFFLQTDDFWRDYRAMTAKGVRFAEAPRDEAYGTVAVFEDCCGNRWDLIQP